MTTASFAVNRRVMNDGNLVLEDIPEIPDSIVEQLNRYQNIRGAELSFWGHDSQSIYISTQFADVSQIHRVDTPLGARHQLTFFQEPFSSAALNPKNSTALIGRDTGGSEFVQIYHWDLDTADSKLLTDGKSKNTSFVWNKQSTAFAYTSTRRTGKANDIWIMDPNEPDGAKIAIEATDGSLLVPCEWSTVGKTLYLFQYLGNQDSPHPRVGSGD